MKGYAPIVRPWLKAGLTALLVEDEARVLELRAVPASPADGAMETPGGAGPAAVPSAPHAPAISRLPASPGISPAAPCQKVSRNAVQKPASPASRGPVPPAVRPAQAEVPRQAVPVQRGGGQSLLAAPGALPVESWPVSWKALRDRRPLPARPRVLWSYAGLGDDLVGTPDEVRRRVIVRMLTELRHPAGTHVFWPFALPGEKPSSEASLFWSGVSMLDPRVLLLFGSDTRDALGMPRSLLPFCQERVHGRLVIQLPRPQALAGDEAAFRQAQAFLSRILRFCASR